MQKLLTFFSKNISIHAIFHDQSFNDMLTNDIVSFKQLSPGIFSDFSTKACVVGTHQQCLGKALLMSTHYICFGGEI